MEPQTQAKPNPPSPERPHFWQTACGLLACVAKHRFLSGDIITRTYISVPISNYLAGLPVSAIEPLLPRFEPSYSNHCLPGILNHEAPPASWWVGTFVEEDTPIPEAITRAETFATAIKDFSPPPQDCVDNPRPHA